ncbi:MAG: hypothetical protein EZS28_039740 [Streblomastix strix]|uniref:Uncharacterized protein n=1 Tax=Streblomastix strix TaxID=222440 RepID=A0A5J4U3B4_9EUKA|nr:MAG: hypothetical protein EZS28_039740 [Streblomastix strix]
MKFDEPSERRGVRQVENVGVEFIRSSSRQTIEQIRSLESDWSRKMDPGRCKSLMEGLTKLGQPKSIVWTAKGSEEYLESRQILGRAASGAQRGYSEGSELPGCDSLQPVLYGPEAGKQMEKDSRLQSSEQNNFKYPLLDGRYQYCNASIETSRLYNSSGFGRKPITTSN